MPFEYPSDNLDVPHTERKPDMAGQTSPLKLGEARDFLSSPWAVLRPRKLLEIAHGLREIVHKQVDYTQDGYLKLLPEEKERRVKRSDEFLKMTPVEFPAEEQKLLEES